MYIHRSNGKHLKCNQQDKSNTRVHFNMHRTSCILRLSRSRKSLRINVVIKDAPLLQKGCSGCSISRKILGFQVDTAGRPKRKRAEASERASERVRDECNYAQREAGARDERMESEHARYSKRVCVYNFLWGGKFRCFRFEYSATTHAFKRDS